MKEILMGMAEYNLKANEKLGKILEGLDEANLSKDQGSFYKSIRGTLEHLLMAEVSWLRRFAGFFSYPSLAMSHLITADPDGIRTKAATGFRDLLALLHEADLLFVAFAKELNEGDLRTRVKFQNSRGESMERAYWNTIIHISNHGTHHRGEISAMLDMQGVSNDYSGFNLYTA